MTFRDRCGEDFGGFCPHTGEEKIELGLGDPSLEGVVPISVSEEIWNGKISSAPYLTLAAHFGNQGGMEPSCEWLEVDINKEAAPEPVEA
jgi:hypothetical protein